jgi:hypothetical protein
MRIIISLFLLLLIPCVVFSEDNLPFDKSTLEQTYKLDNGNTIYIEQTGMNDAIWEKALNTNYRLWPDNFQQHNNSIKN